MSVARDGAAAVAQADGRLLVSGGADNGVVAATSEALDATGTFVPAATMLEARRDHAIVKLEDGRVLVAGGTTNNGATASAEIYDPATSSWTAVGAMAQPRAKAAALLLRDDQVAIVGGENAGGGLATIEIFDAGSGTFTTAFASIQPPRTAMASVLLPNGCVLITGGWEGAVASTRTEIYDPVANVLTPGPNLTSARAGHSATRLQDGSVLVVGGTDGSAELASAEILGRGSNLFVAMTVGLATPRQGHAATLLKYNGSVLITGGATNGTDVLTAERYVPWTATFVADGALSVPRPGAVVGPTSLDGVMIVAGGGGTSSSDLYAFPTVKTDQDDYSPGQTALITGAGFPASSVVTLQVTHLTPTSQHAGHTPWFVATGPLGEFATTWYVYPEDFGALLQLSADCGGEHAEHVFTDAADSTTTVSHAAVTYGSTTTFTLIVTNTSSLGTPVIGSIKVDVPGMTVTGTPTIAAFDGAGSSMPRNWKYDSAASTATSMKFLPGATGDAHLIDSPNGHVDITFTATATAAGQTVTTTAYSSRTWTTGAFPVDSPAVTVDPAPLTVTANNDSKTYNAVAYTGGNGVSYSGFVLSETVSALGGSLTYSGTSQGAVNAGSYAITPAGLTSSNYAIAFTSGTLTIGTKTATVTANNKSKTYGDPNPALDAAVVGQVAGGDAVNYTLETSAGEFSNVGGYPITVSLGSNPNYSVTPFGGTLTIGTKTATVTANNKSKTYGDPNPALDAAVVGQVAGGDAVNYTLETSAGEFSNVGGYPITVSLGSNPNYDVTPFGSTLTINVKTASVTANNKVKAFGDPNPPLDATIVGQVAGGDAVNYSLATTATEFSTVAGNPYPIAVTLGSNPNYSVTPHNGTLTVDQAVTSSTLTVTQTPVQYSDLTTFTATLSPAEIVGSAPATGVQFKVNGSNIGAVQTLTANGGNLTASLVVGEWDVLPLASGNYTVTVVFTGVNANFAVSPPTAAALAVTREDARANYTGLVYVSTASASSSTATVVLSATIQDITAVLPGSDSDEGDIRNATVTFVNRDTNTNIATVAVGLVNPLDVKTGTANYTWNVNIGNNDCETYTIGIVVNNYYTRNAGEDDTVVTVKKATPGSIGGGGFLVNTASQGQYAGTSGLKTNFGLNVKFNKSGANLQGNVNTIVRSGGRVYQIKSNAIDSLNITTIPGGRAATFTSRANLKDITDPLNPIALGGNLSLQVQMKDLGEPGSSDTISVRLTNTSGAMLFASRWNGTQVVEQLLGGGNIQVRQ